ncbi:MAG: hypothetical protein ABSE69_02765 [Roseiarcus sp.]|jgi:hypothetical protein
MNRWGPGLALALLFSQGVVAGDLPSSAQTAKTRANAHCAALGEGFLPVGGSDACVRISGHISAGAGFGAGAARGDSSSLNFDPGPPNGLGAVAAAAGDWRFDTPNGPGRVYLDVGNSANSRWAIDAQ